MRFFNIYIQWTREQAFPRIWSSLNSYAPLHVLLPPLRPVQFSLPPARSASLRAALRTLQHRDAPPRRVRHVDPDRDTDGESTRRALLHSRALQESHCEPLPAPQQRAPLQSVCQPPSPPETQCRSLLERWAGRRYLRGYTPQPVGSC